MEAAMIAREMRPRPGVARQPVSRDEWEEPEDDPMNPVENIPSELDPLTHAEFIAVYNDASTNIRFAKEQQWRTVLYFTIGAIAVRSEEHASELQSLMRSSYAVFCLKKNKK